MKELTEKIKLMLESMIEKTDLNPNQGHFNALYDGLGYLHQQGFDVEEYSKMIEKLELKYYGERKPKD